MTVADATPDYEVGSHDDRAFLGHPKGLGIFKVVLGKRMQNSAADQAKALG